MSQGKAYFVLFDVLDGGMLEPIDLEPSNLKDDKSIILLDEDNQTVWLWHGKLQGLVKRRTALRQAQSLKGHGYQTGNSIIGRDLRHIREIDARKVGRVPEDSETNEEFMRILESTFNGVGNYVYSMGAGGTKKNDVKPAPKTVSEPKKSTPTPAPAAKPATKREAEELKDKLKHVEIEKKEPPKVNQDRKYDLKPVEGAGSLSGLASNPDLSKVAAVFIAVLDNYSDIWISKKEGEKYNIEQMDGKICAFTVKSGKIEYDSDSFKAIPEEKKQAIKDRIKQLL